jgi:hypothetical protein
MLAQARAADKSAAAARSDAARGRIGLFDFFG